MNYDPSIFTRVTSLDAAKRIILTDEGPLKTDQRWERETPHVCDLIEQNVKLTADSVVLDYGCGVGRIAKELIRRHGCHVIGADISPNMLALAASYVASDRIAICHPHALSILGIKVDLALAIWVLQHVSDLTREMARIAAMIKSGGKLFVVNECLGRFIPTTKGWHSDGVDVRAELGTKFKLLTDGHMSPAVVGDEQSKRTFWAVYDRG